MADNPEDDFLDSSESKVDLGDAAYTSAALGSMFAPGAGVADVMGYAPDPFNPGQMSPSFSENVDQGNYIDAGIQTLGLAGDALYAMAPFTAGISAFPAAAAKGVQAMAKSSRAIRPIKAEDLGVLGNKNPDTGEFIPNVFYHGTTDSFEDFKVGPSGAVYVSETPGYAEEYAGFTPEIKSERYPALNRDFSAREGSNIRPVYIKDNLNFFDERNSDHLAALEKVGYDLDEIPQNYPNPYDETFKELIQAGEWEVMEEIAPALKEAGFDGYRTVEGGNYSLAIFDPKNLVSATAKKAKGGVVSLLDIAQNMNRGPKGVASLSSVARNMNRPMVS